VAKKAFSRKKAQKTQRVEPLAKCLSSPNAFIGDPVFPDTQNLDSGLNPAGMTTFSTFARASVVLQIILDARLKKPFMVEVNFCVFCAFLWRITVDSG